MPPAAAVPNPNPERARRARTQPPGQAAQTPTGRQAQDDDDEQDNFEGEEQPCSECWEQSDNDEEAEGSVHLDILSTCMLPSTCALYNTVVAPYSLQMKQVLELQQQRNRNGKQGSTCSSHLTRAAV